MLPKDQWVYRVWDPQLAYDSICDPSAIEAIHHYRGPGKGSHDGKYGSYWFIEQAMRSEVQIERYLTEHWTHRGVIWDAYLHLKLNRTVVSHVKIREAFKRVGDVEKIHQAICWPKERIRASLNSANVT